MQRIDGYPKVMQPPAPHGITGIDHPIIAVRDMQAARKAYERLGFTIPPRGSHVEWGTGNWCIMFEHNYLELRGIIDPARYTHSLERFLAAREGLMGVALGTNNAEASYQMLAESGLHPAQVRHLTRNFELPEGTVQPRFALCFLHEAETPGLMSTVLCQHLTPALLRRSDWIAHANRTIGVASLGAIVPDLAAATAAYQKLFGESAVTTSRDYVTVHLASGQTIVVSDVGSAVRDRSGGHLTSKFEPPCLVSVTLMVNDLARTAALFSDRRIAFTRDAGGALWLSGEPTCGVALRFVDRE